MKAQTPKEESNVANTVEPIIAEFQNPESKEESKENDAIETKEVESHIKHFTVIGESGEFWYNNVKYHHDALDDETAQMLINKGYCQIKFQ